VLRPSGREHGILESGQSTDRHDSEPAPVDVAVARHGSESIAGGVAEYLRIQREGTHDCPVEYRRPEIAALADGPRCVVRGQPRIQPVGCAAGWYDTTDQPGAARYRLSAAVSGPDARNVDGARRDRLHD